MKDNKNTFIVICKRLIFLPVWLIILLCAVSVPLVVLIFINGLEEDLRVIPVYVLSFYTLSCLCVYFSLVFPKKYKSIKAKVYANPLGGRYATDAAFRTHVMLFASLLINLLYVGLNVFSYFRFRSMWFVILALYYCILALMRFLLAKYVHRTGIGKDRTGELKTARLCSVILLTLNFALSGAVLMILYQNRGFDYRGMLIYPMAAYTFYITVTAIVNLIKYRKYNSPVMTTTKIISLCAALVSMLSLECAMLSQFGGELSAEHRWLFIALTGAGVAICDVALSVYMIIRTAKELKKQKESN